MYDSASATKTCASWKCSKDSAQDVATCCRDKPKAKCASIGSAAQRAAFCGSSRVFFSDNSEKECASWTCNQATAGDVALCCRPVATTFRCLSAPPFLPHDAEVHTQ